MTIDGNKTNIGVVLTGISLILTVLGLPIPPVVLEGLMGLGGLFMTVGGSHKIVKGRQW